MGNCVRSVGTANVKAEKSSRPPVKRTILEGAVVQHQVLKSARTMRDVV
jgi:hypothetical protein